MTKMLNSAKQLYLRIVLFTSLIFPANVTFNLYDQRPIIIYMTHPSFVSDKIDMLSDTKEQIT